MSRLEKELHKIRAREQKHARLAEKIQRNLKKNTAILQKTAAATAPQNRMLGVERKRARKKFLIWLGMLLGLAIMAASYIWKNRASILPGDIPYP